MPVGDGFSADVREMDQGVILELHGEVDGFAQQGLDEAYLAAVAGDPSVILLNFSDVDYINSTGIALIVGLLGKARSTGRQVMAYGLTDHYQEIFEITRLADFMLIFPDEEAALAGRPAATG